MTVRGQNQASSSGRALLRLLLPLAAVAFLTTGCGSIGFQRAWARFEPPATATGMPGRWKGEWRSEWNGHRGGLRCLMTQADERHVQADFLSTYASILSFRHHMLFHVVAAEDGTLRFEGEQDLGKAIGGVYRYEGTVVGDAFHATFRAENGDHGVFEMRRVE